MVDSDRDDKVDHVVLTWSEPVTHARDVDQHYPFAVPGYVVTSVGAARRSRSLTLVVRERAATRHLRPPGGALRAHHQGPGEGRQGASRRSGRASPAPCALDVDKDGYAATDCRPTLASVHPGAVDKPDTGLVDANCDGIDGTAHRSDLRLAARPGQRSRARSPRRCATFDQAVTNSGGTRDIYLAAGTYPSALTTPLTSSVYGGYSPTLDAQHRQREHAHPDQPAAPRRLAHAAAAAAERTDLQHRARTSGRDGRERERPTRVGHRHHRRGSCGDLRRAARRTASASGRRTPPSRSSAAPSAPGRRRRSVGHCRRRG